MYLRHEGEVARSFIPEDDKRPSTMAGTLRHADPAARNPWVVKMQPANRMDALMRQYIYDRVEKGDSKREKSIWKYFLTAVNEVTNGDNPAGVAIALRKGEKLGSVEVYAAIVSIGKVSWLPSVTLQGNDKLAEIMRESGPNRLRFTDTDLTMSKTESSTKKGFIPKPIETKLNPGHRV